MNSRRGRPPRRDARPLRCPPSLLRASGIETRSGGVRIFIDGFLSPKVPSTAAVFARVANKGVRGVKARKSGNSKEEVAALFASPWCVRLVCASLVMFGGPQTTRELETGGDQQRLQALAVRISNRDRREAALHRGAQQSTRPLPSGLLHRKPQG